MGSPVRSCGRVGNRCKLNRLGKPRGPEIRRRPRWLYEPMMAELVRCVRVGPREASLDHPRGLQENIASSQTWDYRQQISPVSALAAHLPFIGSSLPQPSELGRRPVYGVQSGKNSVKPTARARRRRRWWCGLGASVVHVRVQFPHIALVLDEPLKVIVRPTGLLTHRDEFRREAHVDSPVGAFIAAFGCH